MNFIRLVVPSRILLGQLIVSVWLLSEREEKGNCHIRLHLEEKIDY